MKKIYGTQETSIYYEFQDSEIAVNSNILYYPNRVESYFDLNFPTDCNYHLTLSRVSETINFLVYFGEKRKLFTLISEYFYDPLDLPYNDLITACKNYDLNYPGIDDFLLIHINRMVFEDYFDLLIKIRNLKKYNLLFNFIISRIYKDTLNLKVFTFSEKIKYLLTDYTFEDCDKIFIDLLYKVTPVSLFYPGDYHPSFVDFFSDLKRNYSEKWEYYIPFGMIPKPEHSPKQKIKNLSQVILYSKKFDSPELLEYFLKYELTKDAKIQLIMECPFPCIYEKYIFKFENINLNQCLNYIRIGGKENFDLITRNMSYSDFLECTRDALNQGLYDLIIELVKIYYKYNYKFFFYPEIFFNYVVNKSKYLPKSEHFLCVNYLNQNISITPKMMERIVMGLNDIKLLDLVPKDLYEHYFNFFLKGCINYRNKPYIIEYYNKFNYNNVIELLNVLPEYTDQILNDYPVFYSELYLEGNVGKILDHYFKEESFYVLSRRKNSLKFCVHDLIYLLYQNKDPFYIPGIWYSEDYKKFFTKRGFIPRDKEVPFLRFYTNNYSDYFASF